MRETLREWQVPDESGRLVDDAVLLTSELVTNAIVHAGTRLQVSCRLHENEIEIAVRDRHPARTLGDSPVGADTERTNGRGLLLPAALAASWGVSYARASKAVWFRITIGEAASPHGGEPADAAPAAWVGGPRPDRRPPGQPVTGDGLTQALPGTVSDGRTDLGRALDGQRDLLADIGRLSYDELLRHTVEMARDVAGADAAYALVADEDGELRIRAGAGASTPELLEVLAGPAARLAQGPADTDVPGQQPAVYDDPGDAPDDLPAIGGFSAASLVTVPFLAEGRVTGVLAAAAAEPGRFSSGTADRLQVVADRVGLSLERARLAEFERARRGRLSFLAEASDLLAGTLDQDKTIALAAQLVVPRLAAWCAVFLADDGAAKPVYVLHADEALADALAGLLASVPPPVAGSRAKSWRWSLAGLPSAAIAPASAAFVGDAVWCCPLIARGRVLGAFVIGRPRDTPFPRAAVEMVEDLGRRAALALDNARLHARQLATSKAWRRTLLPSVLPEVPGLDLAVEYAAGGGGEVGGDFYDVFAVADGRWRFAIGDVRGTGPQAAAATSLARYTMRILAQEGRGIAAVLDRLNRLILAEGPRARFVTLVHGEIAAPPHAAARRAYPGTGGAAGGTAADGGRDRAAGGPAGIRVRMICAGHPVPLLLRSSGAPEPAVPPQPVLGLLDKVAFRAWSFDLSPDDVLLCVTDGVTQRRNGSRRLDDGEGLSRILADCAGMDAAAVASRIMAAVHDFGPRPPADDTALIVLRAR